VGDMRGGVMSEKKLWLELGRTVVTPGIEALISDDAGQYVMDTAGLQALLMRHQGRDWGMVGEEDWKANDRAVEEGERVMSVYGFKGRRVWIITEWDRSVTTILLPEEY
jgi:hypothetical protein